MQLYAITDRNHLASEGDLLSLAEGWIAGGVDFVQLRETDLAPSKLQTLAQQLAAKTHPTRSKLLVNVPTPESASLALEAGADGVHLAGPPRTGSIRAVRRIFPTAIVSVPCHSMEEVETGLQEQADLILFSPVFDKPGTFPQGLDALHHACVAAQGIPVFALGGVTSANAALCLAAGAAGVAGIRLFASGDWRAAAQTQPGERYIVE
jgi:thiamine-phosphate pyrophosphorylase